MQHTSSQTLHQALDHFKKSTPASTLQWAGIRELRERSRIHSVRDGLPQSNDVSVSHGAYVEVLVNGQFAYAATPSLSISSLVEALGRAYSQAERASRFALHRFTPTQRPPTQAEFKSPVSKAITSLSAAEINETLVAITHKLKVSSKIIRSTAYAQAIEIDMHFVSSNGSDAQQQFTLTTSDFAATAQEGSVVQHRSSGSGRGLSYQGGWEHLMLPDLWERVAMVGSQAVELLDAEDCPTETTSLILKPCQMMLQIHESIGHPLELDRILGDERNYAGWSFVKAQDFGHLQYGSKLMNVTFDPTLPQEYASYAIDDNGIEARREFIIKDGLLVRGLGSLESQARSSIPGVANQRASSWNRPPIDRMANLNLEPGSSSYNDIISSTERGVLMESNRSWSIDDFRNKFQFGCEYAKLIQNGRITKTLRNPNYRGITNPFWRSLSMVGDRSTFEIYGTPNCGKGEPNQVIRVGHASPLCKFDKIEVFGGVA